MVFILKVKISIQKKLLFVFSILMLITLNKFILLNESEKDISEQINWVNHTHIVLQEAEALLGFLRDAETGQRGFLLTGKNEYLEPFNNGVEQTKKSLHNLKNLTNDNSLQQVHLGELAIHIEQKFKELNLTIVLMSKNKKEKALDVVNNDSGKIIMDIIRVKMDEFVKIEKQLLLERRADFEHGQEKIRKTYVAEAVFLIIFLMIIVLVIKRQVINPVVILTNAADRMATGKTTNIPIVRSNDEIGKLVSTFNYMSLKIKTAIDELTEAKFKSEENEKKLSDIIWSSNVGTWQWDIDTNEVKLNERWAEMAGYSLSELEQFHFSDLEKIIYENDMEVFIELKEKLLSGEINFYVSESRRYTKSGELIWVSDRARVTERKKDGTVAQVSGATTDITARKQADIAKNDFISVMSHELRTPLTSIKGSLGLIQSGVVGKIDDSVQSMIDVAFNNSERLILLINDILDIEKIESGKMDFEMKSINVNALMNDAIEANAGYAEQCEITFTKSDVADEIFVNGDQIRLMQVFLTSCRMLQSFHLSVAKFNCQRHMMKI